LLSANYFFHALSLALTGDICHATTSSGPAWWAAKAPIADQQDLCVLLRRYDGGPRTLHSTQTTSQL